MHLKFKLVMTESCVCVCFPGPSNVFKIVKMIMERNFQPVIIFSFSKKECEAYALQVSKLDFNTGTYTWTQGVFSGIIASEIRKL